MTLTIKEETSMSKKIISYCMINNWPGVQEIYLPVNAEIVGVIPDSTNSGINLIVFSDVCPSIALKKDIRYFEILFPNIGNEKQSDKNYNLIGVVDYGLGRIPSVVFEVTQEIGK